MASKIKELIGSPYMAPLTQPFKNVAAFALYPLRGLIATLKDKYHDDTVADVLAGGGGLVGAVGGGIGLGIYAATSAFTALGASAVAVKIVAAISAAMVGVLTGAVGGAIAGAGAVVAVAGIAGLTLGFVPGVFQGVHKAYKHHQELKNPPVTVKTQIPPKPPAPTSPPPINPSGHGPKSLVTQLAEKTPEERLELLETLKEKFADEFSIIAQKQAYDATHATTTKPIKVKPPLQVRPGKSANGAP